MITFTLGDLKKLNWDKGLYRLWVVITVLWFLISILDTCASGGWKDIFSCSAIYFTVLPPALLFALIIKRSRSLSLKTFLVASAFPYVHHLTTYGATSHIALMGMLFISILIIYLILRWIFKGFGKQEIDNKSENQSNQDNKLLKTDEIEIIK